VGCHYPLQAPEVELGQKDYARGHRCPNLATAGSQSWALSQVARQRPAAVWKHWMIAWVKYSHKTFRSKEKVDTSQGHLMAGSPILCLRSNKVSALSTSNLGFHIESVSFPGARRQS